MPIRITYRSLFAVEVWHHYFLNEGPLDWEALSPQRQAIRRNAYRLADWLDVAPDPETSRTLAGAGLRLVAAADGWRVAARVNDANQPTVGLPTGPLRFGLLLRDSRFWNYTAARLAPSFSALPAKNADRRVFYFGNVAFLDAPSPVLPALSLPAPPAVVGGNYQMNDLVSVGGQLYEATRFITNSLNPPAAASGWRLLTPNRAYATVRDELRWRPALFNYLFTANVPNALLELRNAANQVVWTDTFTSTTEQRTAPLDLRNHPPGRYRLTVSGGGYLDVEDFYFQPAWEGLPLLGVVEVTPTGLLDGGGALTSPVFTLRFLNRSTRWRYRSSRSQAILPAISGANNPLPLTAAGRVNTVTLNGHGLPNADASLILPVDADDLIYSDVYIDEQLYTT